MSIKYSKFIGSNCFILKNVEVNSKVLDVGCANGKLAKYIKKYKQCHIVGIEIDTELAKIAEDYCDKVIIADIQKDISLPIGYFDVIIFGDILEHVVNPEEVLIKFKKYLSDDGIFLISIPNIANWTIRIKLLFGIFKYTECGILDKTHLRFFTLKESRKMLENCGLQILKEYCTCGIKKIDFKFMDLNPSTIYKSLLCYQFIIKAKKSPVKINDFSHIEYQIMHTEKISQELI